MPRGEVRGCVARAFGTWGRPQSAVVLARLTILSLIPGSVLPDSILIVVGGFFKARGKLEMCFLSWPHEVHTMSPAHRRTLSTRIESV